MSSIVVGVSAPALRYSDAIDTQHERAASVTQALLCCYSGTVLNIRDEIVPFLVMIRPHVNGKNAVPRINGKVNWLFCNLDRQNKTFQSHRRNQFSSFNGIFRNMGHFQRQ